MPTVEDQNSTSKNESKHYSCPEIHAPPRLTAKWRRILKMYLFINLALFAPPVILFGVCFGDKAAEVVLRLIAIFGLPIGIATTILMLIFSKDQVRESMKVRIISSGSAEPQEKFLLELIGKLSAKAGLPACPVVGVFESQEVNAFVTGANAKNAMLAFSSGMLETMPPNSISAVAAHEVGHIRNGDMFTTNILSGASKGVTIGIDLLVNAIALCLQDKHNKEPIRLLAPTIIGKIFSAFGVLVVLAFSRQRELRADYFAAAMISPEEMIHALQSLKEDKSAGILTGPSSPMATMMIAAPEGIADFLSTHPTIEQRIENLRNMEKKM